MASEKEPERSHPHRQRETPSAALTRRFDQMFPLLPRAEIDRSGASATCADSTRGNSSVAWEEGSN